MSTELPLIDWLPTLAVWLSPSFPVGAYAYSHGLEALVESGEASDRADLEDYVTTALCQGTGFCDLVYLAAAWRAQNSDELREVASFARAQRGSAELALESRQQGAAFAGAIRSAWPGTRLDALTAEEAARLPYPVAVGAACSGFAPLEAALLLYAQSFAANLVSAALRLLPLGQTDGQRAICATRDIVRSAARAAAQSCLDDAVSACPLIEIASMRHETQYSRLFRS